MAKLQVKTIGKIVREGEDVKIALNKAYASGLAGLEGFSHIQILWWFCESDNEEGRCTLSVKKPYKQAPATLGVFATRAPTRPNPIALDCVGVTYIDHENAEIGLTHLEAYDGSPVLDIKPYTPSLDRVESPVVPSWCRHWPKSYEASGDFDWENEINP